MSTLKGVVVEVIVVDMAITALEIGGTIGEEGRMAAIGGTDTTGVEDIIEQNRGDVYEILLGVWISWECRSYWAILV